MPCEVLLEVCEETAAVLERERQRERERERKESHPATEESPGSVEQCVRHFSAKQ